MEDGRSNIKQKRDRKENIFGDIIKKYRLKGYSVERYLNGKCLFPLSGLLCENDRMFKLKMSKEKLTKDLKVVLNLQNRIYDKTNDKEIKEKIITRKLSFNYNKTMYPLLKKNVNDLLDNIRQNKKEVKVSMNTISEYQAERKVKTISPTKVRFSNTTTEYDSELGNTHTQVTVSNFSHRMHTLTTDTTETSFAGRRIEKRIKTLAPVTTLKMYKQQIKNAMFTSLDSPKDSFSGLRFKSRRSTGAKNKCRTERDEEIDASPITQLYNNVSKKNNKFVTGKALQNYFRQHTTINVDDE
jgi:hypothetical protein